MNGETGCIHIYCGEGKGKTTAAIGLCVRAAGAGRRVALVQFLKSAATGELAPLGALGVQVLRGKDGTAFSFQMTDEQKQASRRIHDANLQTAMGLVRSGAVDLLVLDEAVGACRRGLLEEAVLMALVRQKPQALELVLTGRNPPEWMLECADYVSEFRKIKHPYEQGIPARKGIEF